MKLHESRKSWPVAYGAPLSVQEADHIRFGQRKAAIKRFELNPDVEDYLSDKEKSMFASILNTPTLKLTEKQLVLLSGLCAQLWYLERIPHANAAYGTQQAMKESYKDVKDLTIKNLRVATSDILPTDKLQYIEKYRNRPKVSDEEADK